MNIHFNVYLKMHADCICCMFTFRAVWTTALRQGCGMVTALPGHTYSLSACVADESEGKEEVSLRHDITVVADTIPHSFTC